MTSLYLAVYLLHMWFIVDSIIETLIESEISL